MGRRKQKKVGKPMPRKPNGKAVATPLAAAPLKRRPGRPRKHAPAPPSVLDQIAAALAEIRERRDQAAQKKRDPLSEVKAGLRAELEKQAPVLARFATKFAGVADVLRQVVAEEEQSWSPKDEVQLALRHTVKFAREARTALEHDYAGSLSAQIGDLTLDQVRGGEDQRVRERIRGIDRLEENADALVRSVVENLSKLTKHAGEPVSAVSAVRPASLPVPRESSHDFDPMLA